MTHLSLRGLGAVLDLRQKLGFDPDALVRDALGVGLGFADQRCKTLAKICRRLLVEAVVDLAGIDQVAAFTAADIDAVPLVAIEREPGDRQRLALCACFLYMACWFCAMATFVVAMPSSSTLGITNATPLEAGRVR
jgi:hypothetical protein